MTFELDEDLIVDLGTNGEYLSTGSFTDCSRFAFEIVTDCNQLTFAHGNLTDLRRKFDGFSFGLVSVRISSHSDFHRGIKVLIDLVVEPLNFCLNLFLSFASLDDLQV